MWPFSWVADVYSARDRRWQVVEDRLDDPYASEVGIGAQQGGVHLAAERCDEPPGGG